MLLDIFYNRLIKILIFPELEVHLLHGVYGIQVL